MSRTHPHPDVEHHRTGVAAKRADRAVARALIVLLAVPLGFLMTAPSLAAPTEAAWQRTVTTGGEVTAGRVPAATLTGNCRVVSLATLGTTIQILWTAPPGYTALKAELHVSRAGAGSDLIPSGTDISGATPNRTTLQYTTQVPTGLLNNTLGGRAETDFAIVINEGGWLSKPATVRFTSGNLLRPASCQNITPP